MARKTQTLTSAGEKVEFHFWTELGKTFISQSLSIILIPISVFMTLWFTESSKVAAPKIVTYSTDTYFYTAAPPTHIYNQLKKNAFLSNIFRREIDFTYRSQTAKNWLDNGTFWDNECATIFRSMSNGIINDDELLKKGRSTGSAAPQDIHEAALLCESLVQTIDSLQKVETGKELRSGQLTFHLTLLNSSSYDGIVADSALLEFDGKKLHIEADSGFLQLKPHSVVIANFSTYYFANDRKFKLSKDIGASTQVKEFSSTPEEYNLYKELSEIVINRKKQPVKLTVYVDNKPLEKDITVL